MTHRLLDVRPGERRALTLAGASFFFLLAAYYIIRPLRTAFFARLDFTVNLLTAVTHVLLTARLIRRFGIAVALAVLPVPAAAVPRPT